MEDTQEKAEAPSSSAAVLESGLERIAKGDLTFHIPITSGESVNEPEKRLQRIRRCNQESNRGTGKIDKNRLK